MLPFQCNLQPQIPKHLINTHAQIHTCHLEATVTVRQKKTSKRTDPHPSHTRGTFHHRLKPLYPKKHNVSRTGFLPKTKPIQHSCNHYNAFHIVSQHQAANPHVSTRMTTQHGNNHAAIPMRSTTTDSKTPSHYARDRPDIPCPKTKI